MEFVSYPKIPRLMKPIIVTEKIDGTNGVIYIEDMSDENTTAYMVQAGSRNRWLTKGDDNFGFAAWVDSHAAKLVELLGPGRHFGEWWGQGIQRGYGLDHRRFSLFRQPNDNFRATYFEDHTVCTIAPILYEGDWLTCDLRDFLPHICTPSGREYRSSAARGYEYPEGVVMYHTAAGKAFKVLCDGQPPKERTEHDHQPIDSQTRILHARIEAQYAAGLVTKDQRTAAHRAVGA